MTTEAINSNPVSMFAISLLYIAAFFPLCLPHKYYQCRQMSANRCVFVHAFLWACGCRLRERQQSLSQRGR